jgi:cell pole-organizing protein PopZ
MGDIQQDPSMEEILASIKRVIAEDGRTAAAARGSRRSGRSEALPPEPDEVDDILELEDPVGSLGDEGGLLSADVAAASRQQLAALAALRERVEPAGNVAGEGALEAVVRDMLRPMLKDWLDQNLPEIVEQLVTREIGRITGRSL